MNLRDDQGRPEPPLASGEAETLVGFLEYQRATFAWKWSGLEVAGLKATLGASTMTLGGMLKHLAYYEDHWFSHRMRGNKRQAVWSDDYWDDDPDWEWNSATKDSPQRLHTLWQDAVSRSRDLLSETLAGGGLDQLARRSLPDGRTPSVRWIVVHMIEEYARHNGHADLIRESVDGLTGERQSGMRIMATCKPLSTMRTLRFACCGENVGRLREPPATLATAPTELGPKFEPPSAAHTAVITTPRLTSPPTTFAIGRKRRP